MFPPYTISSIRISSIRIIIGVLLALLRTLRIKKEHANPKPSSLSVKNLERGRREDFPLLRLRFAAPELRGNPVALASAPAFTESGGFGVYWRARVPGLLSLFCSLCVAHGPLRFSLGAHLVSPNQVSLHGEIFCLRRKLCSGSGKEMCTGSRLMAASCGTETFELFECYGGP